jgi:hypothetical protein
MMGYVINDYLTVQSWKDEHISATHERAKEIFGDGLVTPLMNHPVNHGKTFFVSTSGSKAGWIEAEEHSKNIRLFLNWVRKQRLYTKILWVQEYEEIEESKIVETYDYSEE